MFRMEHLPIHAPDAAETVAGQKGWNVTFQAPATLSRTDPIANTDRPGTFWDAG